MADKLITLSADGATATTKDAALSDIATTALSTTTFVSGTYGLVQKAGLFLAGMAVQNQRHGLGWNPFA